MDALRYFLVPAMTLTGVAGFILGGRSSGLASPPSRC